MTLDDLQALLDASFARSSEHLLSIMTEPRRLSAERLVRELPCPAVLNLGTVTARGEPRVSAVDGHFLDGHWHFTTALDSPKARQLRARPAVSASFTPRDGYGVFCHGHAVGLVDGNERMLAEHFEQEYGMPAEELGEIAYFRVEPDWMVGFAMTDEEMVEIEKAATERAARRSSSAEG